MIKFVVPLLLLTTPALAQQHWYGSSDPAPVDVEPGDASEPPEVDPLVQESSESPDSSHESEPPTTDEETEPQQQESDEPGPEEADDATRQESADEPEPTERAWEVSPYGLLRAGYEFVQNDARYDFVGNNSGFLLGNARIGLQGSAPRYNFSFRISIEGAADLRGPANTPEGELTARLRDAYLRWGFLPFLGVTVGQFKIPFMAGWLGRDGSLAFASRAVGLSGVPVGRGFELNGIVVDRELGVLLGSYDPVYLVGDFGVAYYATLFNGNGANEILDDNGRLAVAGRVELFYGDYVRVGAGIMLNSRTEGPLPDQFEERDIGISADASVRVVGIELDAHFTQMTTEYTTVALDNRVRLEYHLQAGYDLPFIPFPFVLAYRFAYYDPWQSGVGDGSIDLSVFELRYHTLGLRVAHPVASLGLTAWVNYTFTTEAQARSLKNDILQVVLQLSLK